MDQLMNFAWKFMLPMSLINILATGVWRFMPPGAVRWVVCFVMVFGSYMALGRALFENKHLAKRRYRYAE